MADRTADGAALSALIAAVDLTVVDADADDDLTPSDCELSDAIFICGVEDLGPPKFFHDVERIGTCAVEPSVLSFFDF